MTYSVEKARHRGKVHVKNKRKKTKRIISLDFRKLSFLYISESHRRVLNPCSRFLSLFCFPPPSLSLPLSLSLSLSLSKRKIDQAIQSSSLLCPIFNVRLLMNRKLFKLFKLSRPPFFPRCWRR